MDDRARLPGGRGPRDQIRAAVDPDRHLARRNAAGGGEVFEPRRRRLPVDLKFERAVKHPRLVARIEHAAAAVGDSVERAVGGEGRIRRPSDRDLLLHLPVRAVHDLQAFCKQRGDRCFAAEGLERRHAKHAAPHRLRFLPLKRVDRRRGI